MKKEIERIISRLELLLKQSRMNYEREVCIGGKYGEEMFCPFPEKSFHCRKTSIEKILKDLKRLKEV